jgi:hypothetical protein
MGTSASVSGVFDALLGNDGAETSWGLAMTGFALRGEPTRVYVDELAPWGKTIGYHGPDAKQAARVGRRHGHQWCHLFADDADCKELHDTARRLGLRREWFQGDHYDLVPTKRTRAIALGAIEVSRRESVEIFRGHRSDSSVSAVGGHR